MNTYEIAIRTGLFVFPILALIFTIPYAIHQYRKYGAMLAFKILMVYSFILYLLIAYFMVILPLPPRSEVALYTSPTMQLVPFSFIADIQKNSSFVLNDFHTYFSTLKSFVVFQVAANIIMTIPFGMYLRYYFRRNFFETMLLSFALSLFFELTQLSGLYGIYPRPYRLFDVDDLMTNTLGGCIGYIITPIFIFFLPSRDTLDKISYKKGFHVSMTRRLFAAGTDFALLALINIAVFYICKHTNIYTSFMHLSRNRAILYFTIMYAVEIFVYFIVFQWISGGRTIGKVLVKFKINTNKNRRPAFWQFFVRYVILYYIIVPTPFVAIYLFDTLDNVSKSDAVIRWIFIWLCVIIYFVFLIQILISFLNHKPQFIHGLITGTKPFSTSKYKHNSQE